VPLTIRKCPGCGAPLELDAQGDCRWCRAHVTEVDEEDEDDDDHDAPVDAIDDPDPYHEDEAVALLRRLDLEEDDDTVPVPVSTICAVLRYAAFDGAARRFLEAPERAAFVRALIGAVRAAGLRAKSAGATDKDGFDRGDEVYALEEWWTLDLATDFLAVLASVDGVESGVRSALVRNVKLVDDKHFDKPWARGIKKKLHRAHDAGDAGPPSLRPWRATIPRRTG
jgi:hypothetical protein